MSSSSSGSYIPNYSQSAILEQIAQEAENMGNQTYAWGQNQVQSNNAITNETLPQYFAAANQANQLAGESLSAYQNTYLPEDQALATDAAQYASPDRIAQNMGAAEAGQAQAADAARNANVQALQSYGIDPSSGRYASLDQASRTQQAAAEAGAGQQAMLATQNTGLGLLGESIQVGETMPGQAINALGMDVQGLSGAENAQLATSGANTQAEDAAAPYMNSAASLKYPPLGSSSSSSQPGQRSGSPQGGGGGPGGGSMGGGGAGGGGIPANGPGPGPYNSEGGAGGSQPGSSTTSYGGSQDYAGGGVPAGPDSYGGGADTGDFSGSSVPQYSGSDNAGGTNEGVMSPGSMDFSGSDFGGGSFGGTSGFAAGGPVPGSVQNSGTLDSGMGDDGGVPDNATTGGYVPQSASPSQGQQTDDIPARLNADEFVVPRDVTLWKGQEFFQNLIDQSRKKRMGASAQGKPKPALGGPPRFQSQAMR